VDKKGIGGISMAKVVYFNTYKLIKGSDVQAFKQAVGRLVKVNFTKEKGCLSFKLFAQGDEWADCSEWESREAYDIFLAAAEASPGEEALAFYKFLNFSTCKSRVYMVEQDIIN
jgi:quinol monooxygenase YgiN